MTESTIDTNSSVNVEQLLGSLANLPIFYEWSRDQLISIIPFIEQRKIKKEEALYKAGDEIQNIFVVEGGNVKDGEETISSGSPPLGLEILLGKKAYSHDAVALDECQVLSIPSHLLPPLSEEDNVSFYDTFYSRWSNEAVADQQRDVEIPSPEETSEQEGLSKSRLILSWLVVAFVPFLVNDYCNDIALPWYQNYFITILSGLMMVLVLNLVPPYSAVLVATLACLLFEVVPVDVMLSGFSTGSFFMALSIFGLGSVLMRSGLVSRLVLSILHYSPQTRFWHNTSVFFAGILMTPCLPSANARISMMTPLLKNVSRAVGYRDGSREATQLMLSMFVGCSIFAPIFLTSKSLNFVLYDMLPQQVSESYQWLNWFFAASVAGVIMLVLYIVLSSFFFKSGQQPNLSKTHFDAQLRMQGALNRLEWVALIGTFLFILAIISYSFHKISPYWMALGTFCAFLIVEAMHDEDVHHDIEWDILLLIGFFICLNKALAYTGISGLLSVYLSGLTPALDGNIYLFSFFVLVLITALRVFLPITTAAVLAASILLPLAKLSGVDPWLACFIILMMAEFWVLPGQCSYYGTYQASSDGSTIDDSKLFLRINIMTIAIRLVAIFGLIQYFEWGG